jgi:chromosomal replication initiator protein
MTLDTSAQRVWEAALGRLQLQVTRPSFDTWLRDTSGLSLAEQCLVVGVPTTFAAEWLERRMYGLIETAVSAVSREPLEVAFKVRNTAPVAEPAALAEENHQALPAMPRGTPTPSGLNKRYIFDSFVVGPCNQLAYAASLAVSDRPGDTYNPLFIYSSVGLGKTHLLQAIAHRVRAQGKKAHYVTSEQFTNEFVGAIQARKTADFRDRYRGADMLLIDDIQFISGKEQTQEGFFHTFNALHTAGKQVVIACDRPPSALALLEERLQSRFEWGLTADIQPPTLETRLAILLHRAESAPVPVPTAVLELIAERMTGNVRQLEGGLNKVVALSHFTGNPISIDMAENILGPNNRSSGEVAHPTTESIIEMVASHFSIPLATLSGPRRDKPVVHARQVAMFLLTHEALCTPEEAGRALGGRDRTTALYAIRKITGQAGTDSTFAQELQQLRTNLHTLGAATHPNRA